VRLVEIMARVDIDPGTSPTAPLRTGLSHDSTLCYELVGVEGAGMTSSGGTTLTGRGQAGPAPARPGARLGASVVDYGVIVGWLAVLTGGGFAVRALLPPGDAGAMPAVAYDAVAFAFSVLPVWLYLTLTEAGARQATWGKRRAGLVVVTAGGGRPGWRRIAVRNAVKLLPWQLAHIAVARLILGGEELATIWTTDALSLLIATGSIVAACRDPWGRALHDRVAGTRVVSR
jgi:uncharacterized RDD family membrane protein YckC